MCSQILQERENLEMLMTGLQSNVAKTADTMHVLMGLVGSAQGDDDDDDEFPDPDAQKTEEPKETPAFVAVICEHMPALAASLAPAGDPEKVVNIPVGPVKPPLGRV